MQSRKRETEDLMFSLAVTEEGNRRTSQGGLLEQEEPMAARAEPPVGKDLVRAGASLTTQRGEASLAWLPAVRIVGIRSEAV